MSRSQKAYTLIELLAVIAILSILACLLMPVFVQVKSSANKTLCTTHFKQAALATEAYVNDYDEHYMPISYRPGQVGSSRTDRTWVQLLLPYARSFAIFQCPSDTSRKPNLDSTFDEDLVPGDLYSEYYRASKRTNMGYNYMTLSPVERIGGQWVPVPVDANEIQDPSGTMLFIDSVWSVGDNDQPVGGGNWLVEPPCRYMTQNGVLVDLLQHDGKKFQDIYSVSDGWTLDSGYRYGGAWPWHFGRVNIARADGSATSESTAQLSIGCNVMPNWGGEVTSPGDSPWFSGL